MNNQFYEIPNDWYNEFNNNFINSLNNGMNYNKPVMMNNNDLTNPKEALDRGNLFNSLYDPYKNYKFRELRPSNRKEELLYNIMMHIFVLTELDLYLDMNPLDMEKVGLYNKYLNNKKELVNEYERNYGLLTLDGINVGTNDWNWKNSPWPWEGTK